jgi:hypothetical protein
VRGLDRVWAAGDGAMKSGGVPILTYLQRDLEASSRGPA